MDSVQYDDFRAAVCDDNRCWQSQPLAEATVTVDLGAGWTYFRAESHFASRKCMGSGNTIAEMCDGIGVPLQFRRQLVFLELKTRGKFAEAVEQIRAGVEAILCYGIPDNVVLLAEIWYSREPKATITLAKTIDVKGREVFVRHRRSA